MIYKNERQEISWQWSRSEANDQFSLYLFITSFIQNLSQFLFPCLQNSTIYENYFHETILSYLFHGWRQVAQFRKPLLLKKKYIQTISEIYRNKFYNAVSSTIQPDDRLTVLRTVLIVNDWSNYFSLRFYLTMRSFPIQIESKFNFMEVLVHFIPIIYVLLIYLTLFTFWPATSQKVEAKIFNRL